MRAQSANLPSTANGLRDDAKVALNRSATTETRLEIASLPKRAAARQLRARIRRYLGWLKILPIALVIALVVRHRVVAPVPAHRHVVDRGDVAREVFGRASIESRREVQLGFDLVGRITDVLVDEGDRVKLGQVVAHLAPEQFQADVHAASSGVPLARAAIARLAAEEHRAQATLTFAQQEAVRLRALAASGSVSPRDLDLAEQQLSLAHADLERVRATQTEAQKSVAVASSTTASKEATVTRAVLTSPFEGLVARRFKDPGDTVVVGSTVLRIVAVDRLWARAAVDESMLANLREGLPAQIMLLGGAGDPLQGSVDRIGREVDRQTHEVLVDVLLAKVPSQLAIGQRADVYIETDRRKNVTRIPVAFLRREGMGAFVYLGREGRVARTPVQIGLVGRDYVEVTSGLVAGDVVLDAPTPGGELAVGRRWAEAP
jgi:HlyD family secretion protein